MGNGRGLAHRKWGRPLPCTGPPLSRPLQPHQSQCRCGVPSCGNAIAAAYEGASACALAGGAGGRSWTTGYYTTLSLWCAHGLHACACVARMGVAGVRACLGLCKCVCVCACVRAHMYARYVRVCESWWWSGLVTMVDAGACSHAIDAPDVAPRTAIASTIAPPKLRLHRVAPATLPPSTSVKSRDNVAWQPRRRVAAAR